MTSCHMMFLQETKNFTLNARDEGSGGLGGGGGGILGADLIHFLYKVLEKRSVQK